MKKIKKSPKKLHFRKSRKILSYIRGSATISLMVIVIIIGSIMLAGGIFPKTPGSPGYGSEGVGQEGQIDETSLNQSGSQNNLQLQTIKFKLCETTAAVDFLVDNSGSMQFGTKMQDLKAGLIAFSNAYPEIGVIGLQVYSDPTTYPLPQPTIDPSQITPEPTPNYTPGPVTPYQLPPDYTPAPIPDTPTPAYHTLGVITAADNQGGYKELVPISRYSEVKNIFKTQVESMRPAGGTYSKNAMEFAKEKILKAKEEFPDNNFNLIFISDGIPETGPTNRACPGGPQGNICAPQTIGAGCRCFDQEQSPESVASEIKNAGVRIFTIAYVDTSEQKFNDLLQSLMRNVASTPEDYYQAPVTSQISSILAQIAQKFCQ